MATASFASRNARATRDTMLGIVAAGYGDGYSRFIPPGSPIIVNGRRATVAGLVFMDLTRD
jgi:alanine racemase